MGSCVCALPAQAAYKVSMQPVLHAVDEKKIMAMVDTMAELGLPDLGYEYFNLDGAHKLTTVGYVEWL
jgi:hypothetical protein